MSDQPFGRSRRDFMRIAVTAGTATAMPWIPDAQAATSPGATDVTAVPGHPVKGTQLILLGTKGGPTPSDLRAAPANVLIVDGQPYVVDCGNGVALQLTKAGIKLSGIRDVFLTHHHSDHNADLGNLVFGLTPVPWTVFGLNFQPQTDAGLSPAGVAHAMQTPAGDNPFSLR
ncbi:MBL fold metallo-hydrolase [Robbsia andropogonis]|uniref:MBL fold metallo-hydrolase n=1 Tax=Robbsia andropogonis TaxID=28092 RepID=UPI003D1A847E